MPRILVFDVNETLLDLRALRVPFREVFGTPDVRTEWFQTLLHQAFLTTITGPYVDFTTLGRQALTEVAEARERSLTSDEQDLILETIKELPPHEEVEEASPGSRTRTFASWPSATGHQRCLKLNWHLPVCGPPSRLCSPPMGPAD